VNFLGRSYQPQSNATIIFMKKDGAHLLLFNKNKTKIFLVRRNDYPLWGTTGGGIDLGESPERTGFEVRLNNKVYEYTITNTQLLTGTITFW